VTARRLEEKVAVVIGAGSVASGWGNGRAIAKVFADNGGHVVAADVNPDALEPTLEMIRGAGGSVLGQRCNALDQDSIDAVVARALEVHGRVDVLVNVVGGSRKGGAAELSPDEWDAQLDYNLGSVYRACRSVLPHMVEQKSGSIVNIASTSGLRYTGSPQVGYASSKAGVISFSRVTAVQYGPMGVRCNTVVPGQLHTPMVEARLAHQRAGGDAERLLAERAARVPLPWDGDGRDTAYAALFLASDEARFVTGTEIVVDGGMTARCD
jgi:NAD(P)-dependent dehydrogenase (short-subunit alcohol dehydrogenase family)